MRAIEIGRRLVQLDQTEEAVRAYTLALEKEGADLQPLEKMEAAAFLLESGGDYKLSYDAFLSLYGEGQFREDIFSILREAFYAPNEKELRKRYKKNTKALGKYPWIFQKEFPAFDSLPLLFFPYDDNTWVPFDTRTGEFLPKFTPMREEITRYFFRDLDKPILASDVFSRYEMEYLCDNVRRSEDLGRENHVYLHYTDWTLFCSYLQVWDLSYVLNTEKAVFLFGDELSLYPIDFKARFGIDYSQYPLKPLGIREICKLIWHTQLSAHNGGDFFNEIFDSHPNLLFLSSIHYDAVQEEISDLREALRVARNLKDLQEDLLDHWENPRLVRELYQMKKPTDKDLLVALYLGNLKKTPGLNPASRIVPALFFQPHFGFLPYSLTIDQNGDTVLYCKDASSLGESDIFRNFKYIKTFTPVRRFTTSYGGAIRFTHKVGAQLCILEEHERAIGIMEGGEETGAKKNSGAEGIGAEKIDAEKNNGSEEISAEKNSGAEKDVKPLPIRLLTITDILGDRVRNRSFMVDPEDRLFRDSILVRMEDGKLNPEATFTRLAAFLDIPYGETMTYCSGNGERDPATFLEEENKHYSRGFDLKSVYATYDNYVCRYEKLYIEYLMRDAYAYFGYDFQCYDGSPVDEDTMRDWIAHFDTQEWVIRETQAAFYKEYNEYSGSDAYRTEEAQEAYIQERLAFLRNREEQTALALMAGLRFVNQNGVPLRMGRLLEPDPALLVKPLYH